MEMAWDIYKRWFEADPRRIVSKTNHLALVFEELGLISLEHNEQYGDALRIARLTEKGRNT